MVANVLMTRYKEIRLVFNAKSRKNKKMELQAEQGGEGRIAVELVTKTDDKPLEEKFIPRLVEAHNLYLSDYLCLLEPALLEKDRKTSFYSFCLWWHILRIKH